ncbi:Aminotransferase-like, plant mobile domain [Sesbania bispinosa]|nr:Aminotransferase-like, plant mobile domain [Sesbania bispinosa]
MKFKTPTHTVRPSLLRSRLIRGEFPWAPCNYVTRASFTSCWSDWVSHVFANDPPFVKVMEKVDRSKELKAATIESAKYSREFLARLRADAPPASDMPHRKVRETGNVLFPGHRKMARESLKYTYATWISSSVFIMACLLAEGVRLPLAFFYLGSLYGRLDQIQEQLFSSYGRFPINSFVDLVFLQSFLFERFPEYAPVRSILDPSRDEKAPEVEPRVWGWSMGRPRRLLIDLIDEEDQFSHRPYTQNFFPGMESLHRLYQESEFATRNAHSSRVEGVYDMWQLILFPQVPPGFIITDIVSITWGAFWTYTYRPDRVCRQFGIDQPPCSLDLDFCNFSEAMKAFIQGFRRDSSLRRFQVYFT